MAKEVLVADETTKTALEEMQNQLGVQEGKETIEFKIPDSKSVKEAKEVKVDDDEDDIELTVDDKDSKDDKKDDKSDTFKVDGDDVKLEDAAKAVRFVKNLQGDDGLKYLQLIAQKTGLELVEKGSTGKPTEKPTKQSQDDGIDYEKILGEEGAFLGPGITSIVQSVLTGWAQKELIPRLDRLQTNDNNTALDIAREKLRVRYDDFDDLSLEVEALLGDYPHKRGTMEKHLERLYKMVKAEKGETVTKLKRTERVKKNEEEDPKLRSTDLEDKAVKTLDKEPETVEDAVAWAFDQLMNQAS